MLFFDLDARIVSRNSTLPYSTLKPKANLVRETLAKRFRTDKIAIGVLSTEPVHTALTRSRPALIIPAGFD